MVPAASKRLPTTPVERALRVISGRWKLLILWRLFDGARRFSELQRLVSTASQKMLIQQLREMEAHGLVTRRVYAEVPPKVEYSATALGHSLKPIVITLCEWGRMHEAELSASLFGADPDRGLADIRGEGAQPIGSQC